MKNLIRFHMNLTPEKIFRGVFLVGFVLLSALLTQAQTPTVGNLVATGTNIKWYSSPTGGTALSPSTILVDGQTYYASQTIDGVESLSRLAVVANLSSQTAPTAATHVPSTTGVVWNWNSAGSATGYKWNTVNTYSSATDMGTALTKTETGLTCGTSYTRYVWAYNSLGCASEVLTLTQTTSSCFTAPTVVTNTASGITASAATLNGNISATGGANATVRGFKYSTTAGFDPSTGGTNVSESGSYGTGSFSANLTGLSSGGSYYYHAYATNTYGTTYGSEQAFTTSLQTDFSYTGSMQSFTVPAGVTSVTIEAWGAQGWSGTYSGGKGGYAKGTLAVTPGQTLYIFVGGQGTVAIGEGVPSGAGWNGGGLGQTNASITSAGGGGGASDVRAGGTALGNRVIVAAGGGGSTNNSSCYGGDGGGLTGAKGGGSYGGGYGGTQTEGGTFGGTLGQGGNALVSYTPWNGGGGGGYYGGGTSDAHGPGGGGSSYIGGVTGGSTLAGQKTGNGRVLISY